jgi:hypothetical protein
MDEWADFGLGPVASQSSAVDAWRQFLTDRKKPPVSMCQSMKFGSSTLLRSTDHLGRVQMSGQAEFDNKLFGDGTTLSLLSFRSYGNSVELYVQARKSLTRQEAARVYLKLVRTLELPLKGSQVIFARNPWFFYHIFPNRNPWFAPDMLTLEQALKNRSLHCHAFRGEVQCDGELEP